MKYYCKIILLITLNNCKSFKIWTNNISIISHRHINPLLYHISDIINNKKQHRISGHKEENSDLPATLLNIWFAIDLGWENVHNELQFLAHQHLLYHNQLMNYIWFGPLMYILFFCFEAYLCNIGIPMVENRDMSDGLRESTRD